MTAAPARLLNRLKRTEEPTARAVLLHARGGMHYARRGHEVRARALRRYLASTEDPKLQIGSGPQRLSGWLNSDLIMGDIYLNLGRPLPLPSSSFAYVFGEHVIEHLPERAAAMLLTELRRVLRPDGVLRLTTPDLEKIIGIYEDRSPIISRTRYGHFLDKQTGKPHARACQILNDYMRLWGHRWIYDEEDLTARLRAVGFGRVSRHETGESDHPCLRGLERHGGADWVNRAEAMCLEAEGRR